MVSSSLRASKLVDVTPPSRLTRLDKVLAVARCWRGAQRCPEAKARRLGPQPGGARACQTPSTFGLQLRRRFGNVFSLQQGWTPVVVLNGLAAVREALVHRNQETSDRPPPAVYEHVGYGPRAEGVILARYGKAWREQRRFSLSTLRNFGLGKKSLEQWVTEEASCLCAAFADQAGRPFSPKDLLNKAVSNVIASLTFGFRFEYNDPRIIKLLDLMDDMLKEESGLVRQVVEAVPMLLRIPGLAAKVFPGLKAFMALIDELITEQKMTRDPTQPPRHLTDAFLDEMKEAKGNAESSFNDENLRLVVTDLFSAGMVTTSTTLAWALLLMILHPDVQRRVQQEIDEVIGKVRRPEMGDQAFMPFTVAVVHEVQRFSDIIPLGLPHMTTRDIEVQGFYVPKVLNVPAWVGVDRRAEQGWLCPPRAPGREARQTRTCLSAGARALRGGDDTHHQPVVSAEG
nr:cytochrome P450 2D14-like isoform X3 [Ovis aries]